MRDPATTFSRRRALGMGAAALLAPDAAFASAGLETIHGAAFGTTWRVTGPAGSKLEALRRPVDQLLTGIDRRMSPWRSDSEVGRFNSGHAGGHAISDDTATVTAAALRVAEESGGCFDPTFGPAVSHWGFGPITGGGATGWRGLALSGGRLTKAWSDLTFDPCGIAKGWALDRLADLAQAAGHADLLLDLGGELAAVGHHPSGRPWQVAIEDPRRARTGLAAALTFEAGAVATSGLRAQSYTLDGRTYGHIIDPTTGEPVQGRLLSVTVLARSAMEADAWATALFAAGDAEGPALARRRGIRAVFLFDDNGLRQETTGGAEHALL